MLQYPCVGACFRGFLRIKYSADQMLTFGIYTKEQHLRLGDKRRFAGPRAAYNLLRLSDNPTPEEVRAFEDLYYTLRTSNGTFRTTFRNRFVDVDAASLRWIGRFGSEPEIRVQDRAVSSGLTSAEWARSLFAQFPAVSFEASDLMTELLELRAPDGEIWILEPNGTALQWIKPPFVVSICHPESWRNPFLRWVAARARKRFAGVRQSDCEVRRISCIHPEAQALCRSNPGFRFGVRSVFDRTPGACHVLRTMNILNRAYFPDERLAEAGDAAFESLRPGGIWIVGRTLEEDASNHVTCFLRAAKGWEPLERIGNGSEIEALVMARRIPA
jgi:hypothetical protein